MTEVETESILGVWSELHFTFLCAEKGRKFAENVTVCLVLAPFNLKPLSLIRPLPHALWLMRNPMRGTGFAG